MIIYFADRQMQVLGHASTEMLNGYVITEDLKTEDIETGAAVFSCRVGFNKKNRLALERMTDAGNYLFRSNDGENEFYTIIDSEIDTRNQEIYIYAENAGLDLLNEIAGEFEATESKNAEWYINKYILDSGFEIGINEIPSDTVRKLKWDGESTVTARLASIATQFGGYEISFSFAIKGLEITNKYVNIHKERGQDNGVQLRLNRELDRIITARTVANLATAFVCEGGVPDKAEEPITFSSTNYTWSDDDDDFFIDGNTLKSKKANEKWSRYVWNKEPNKLANGEGYIVRPYSYDTTDPATLRAHAVTELKKVCDMQVNYEVDIKRLPEGVKIGDRVNIVDDAGETYISSRILMLESSVVDQKHTATIGEHLIKKSGISQKVADLAAEFAKTSQSAARALTVATNARTAATEAQGQAEAAAKSAEEANKAADEAQRSASAASGSSAEAAAKALAAEAAANKAEGSVESIKQSVENAQAAAADAEKAAETAEGEAQKAAASASKAATDAGKAKTAAGEAKTASESAVEKANTAIDTAGESKTLAQAASDTAAAAKLDAEQAEKDVEEFAKELETTVSTMKAEYARKTDLTEASAELETQIKRNAGLLSSTIAMQSVIDETANNAQTLAEQALAKANKAKELANAALEDAEDAQEAADLAAQEAESAQAEADIANEAAATAQAVVDQAEADLAAAKADLETISGRADATKEEIAAAEQAVAEAQSAADTAKGAAAGALETAAAAQATADAAIKAASEAQATADAAALNAMNAQSLANETNAAYEAQATADKAVDGASKAQGTAAQAAQAAADADAKAQKAQDDAAAADEAAKAAAEQVATAQTTLATAKQTLADTLAKVDATEEEIAAAEKAVEDAKASVEAAIKNAAEATGAAELAAVFAKDARTAADEAQTAADNAQKAADEAKDAADKAQDDVDDLVIRVGNAETQITQTNNELSLKATKKEVESIQVGGRNLLRGTATAKGWSQYNTFDGSTREFTRSASGSTELFIYCENLFDLEAGQEYTLSFEAKHNGYVNGLDVYILPESWQTTGIALNKPIRDLQTEYKKYILTFKPNADATNLEICQLRFDNNGTTETDTEAILYIKNVKLEKGNKATDWTYAPEDFLDPIAAAQDDAQNAIKSISEAQAQIQLLADSISQLVREGESGTLLKQDSTGLYYFDISSIQKSLNDANAGLDTLEGVVLDANGQIDVLKTTAEALKARTEYVRSYTDDNGQPCLELGEGDSTFKVRITNTEIQFEEDGAVPASINRKMLVIEKTMVKQELQFGDETEVDGVWIWKRRSNGNLGLTWKEVNS